MNHKISASLMCADLMNLQRSVNELTQCGIEMLHCDVMDGHFVPNWMMFPDLINAVGGISDLPLDIHLMIDEPIDMISHLNLRPIDIVSISYESTPHPQRALQAVREKGAIQALAINPGTPLCAIEELLPDIGMLLLMTVNPGFSGQKMIPQSIDKISRAKQMLDSRGYTGVPIEVDGNCSFENVPMMVRAGASIIVAGTSSIYRKGLTLAKGVQMLRQAMKA
jgi:ribulose-phosphate 3-epimerase